MKALILAAGYATRLYPLTRDFPKPLLKVGRRPIIDYIVGKIEGVKEVDTIFVITNDRFFSRFQKWASALKTDKDIKIINDRTKGEKEKLGAIGDMFYALKHERIDDDLLVVGGDNLFDGSLSGFVKFAKEKGGSPCVGLYDIKSREQAKKYGVAYIDEDNKILDFKEKPKEPVSALIAMCLYYFPRARAGLIGEYMSDRKNNQDASGFYIDWLRGRCPVYGFVFSGRWFDIGHHNLYNQAKLQFAKPGVQKGEQS